MRKIGIDFGTTYSSICFVDENFQPGAGEYVQPFRTGADETLIPSAVAYHIDGIHSLVGSEALGMLGDPEYQVCQHFKMLLALEGTPLLAQFIEAHPDYGVYSTHPPSKVAHDYFAQLLHWYSDGMAVTKLEKIVLTMPLVWTGFDQQLHENTGNAQKLLSNAMQTASAKVFGSTVKPQILMRSEPEAAAGYFGYLHQLKHGQTFSGQMLVVDHGGGTLDVTLAEVQSAPEGISVASKSRSGKGRPLNYALGVAGVAYDRALGNIALEQAQRPLNSTELGKFLNVLERNKRQPAMRARLNEFETQGINGQGMNVEGIRITPELCKRAFMQVNAKPLQEALDEVLQEFPQAATSPDLLVALAGGFSNLPFVEHLVRERFGAKVDITDQSDPRFALNTRATRSHAIAMGAALVAAQKVTIDDKLHYEIGVFVYHMAQEKTVYEPIIAYGSEYAKLQQVIWMPYPVQGGAEGIKLGLKESGRADRAPRPFSLKNLNEGKNRVGGAAVPKAMVPDYQAGCTYKIGFSVPSDDESGISGRHDLLIHFRNEENGKEKAYPIGEVYIEFETRLDKV